MWAGLGQIRLKLSRHLAWKNFLSKSRKVLFIVYSILILSGVYSSHIFQNYSDPTLLPSEQPMSSQPGDQHHQCWIRWAPPKHLATIWPPPETNLWSFETEVRFQERTNRWLIWVETDDLSGATWANNTHSLMPYFYKWNSFETFTHTFLCPLSLGQSWNMSNIYGCACISWIQAVSYFKYINIFFCPEGGACIFF